jgi:hypothetical protein
VDDQRGSPKVSNNLLEEQLHGGRFAGIARVAAHAMRLLEILQDRFVRVPGCDAHAHTVFRE